MSQREAEAAKELLLTRLMSVHPEVYGGGRVELDLVIVVELSEAIPSYVQLPTEFMGFQVAYRVTGWRRNRMPYLEPHD